MKRRSDIGEADTTKLPATEGLRPDASARLDGAGPGDEGITIERLPTTLTSESRAGNTLIWGGLLTTVLGFVAITYTWGKVAAQVMVSQQLPYVVSGGLTGLAMVIIGVAAVDMGVRQQDAAERRQQLSQLARILHELRRRQDDETRVLDLHGEGS